MPHIAQEEGWGDALTNPLRLRLIPYNARLVDARKEKGLTQKDLALLTGLRTGYLGHIETLRVIPNRQAIDEICSALELPADYLFPTSLMEAIKEGVFGQRFAELEEKQVIRLTEGRRAGLLSPGGRQDEALAAIDETVDNDQLKKNLADVMDTLPDRERQVLELRFGLKDGISRTLEEVGKIVGSKRTGEPVNSERIRQIEAKALRLLRHPRRSRMLKDYLE